MTVVDWINSERSSGRIELTEAGMRAFANPFDELMTQVTFNEESWCVNRDENEVTFGFDNATEDLFIHLTINTEVLRQKSSLGRDIATRLVSSDPRTEQTFKQSCLNEYLIIDPKSVQVTIVMSM
ncbi:MAG: hypothetical protein MR008_03735 [Aerococcus sp.]|nr:hypothetical protein [Aerococcus sp.]